MLLFGALVRRKICVHKFIGSFLGCYTRDMITICIFFQLFADGARKLLISFFYKMKYVISSSVFVFTQSDLGCRCAKFGIWLHFSFYILLVSLIVSVFWGYFFYSLGEYHGQLFWFVFVSIISKLPHKLMHFLCHWACHDLGYLLYEEGSVLQQSNSALQRNWKSCFWHSITYNHVHNILRLFDSSAKFPFTTSETKREIINIVINWYIGVAWRRKTWEVRKFQENLKIS